MGSRLGLKLFLSYLVIIAIGAVVLVLTTDLAVPRAFQRHLGQMSGEMMMGPRDTGSMLQRMSLYGNFQDAVREALTLALVLSTLAAVIVSLVFSRRMVAPLRAMMAASQRIAGGHYNERVRVSGPGRSADELTQLSLHFNQMAERLEQTEALRSQLIGDVAHELRTPLTTIKGSMEGLMDGVLPANDETYQQIHREAGRLQRLVDDLQELSRVESGAYTLHPRAVSLQALVEAVERRLNRQYEEKGVAFTCDLPAGLPAVWVDEDRADQVLTNLSGNALQYTPPGGTVHLSAQENGAAVQVNVQDSGIGIPAEHLEHIFTRFYRVDKSRARPGGGSGIGLTIARFLVEAQGGRIWAESPGPGQGSTFHFTLPTAPPGEHPA
ncbi:MAG: HAMP domain-containing histidine kinase [Chloroflexi bacterium]|nr:HAMP domain-containing sensor histidine kinase [Anaerolineaceae bacterium]NMB87216.1 HAMP domain-containing histidine kinase [Chloroflexota bacterium]